MKTPSISTFALGRVLFPVRSALIAANLVAMGTAGAAEVPVRLTLNPGDDRMPAWDPRGETIVYMRSASASGWNVPYNLYQVQAGTPGESVFATGPTYGYGLANAPAWIGSTGFLGVEERAVYHEYLKFDASKAPFTRTVTDGNDAAFTQLLQILGGGGGGRIIFSSDGMTALWRWSTDGGSGTQQIRTGPVSGLTGQAASSAGTLLIETYHVTEQRLLAGAAISPDGSLVIMPLPYDGPNGTNTHARDLWLYHRDGSVGPINLTLEGVNGVFSDYPAFLPDGDRIVYSRYSGVAGDAYDLYQMKIDGTGRQQMTNTPKFSEYVPAVSGDGGRVAFMGLHVAGFESTEPALPLGEVANPNIYVMPLDNPYAVPEISVVQVSGLIDGASTVNFGSTNVGSTGVAKTFTISNQGTGDLTGLAVSVDGSGAAQFKAGGLGATTLAPGASTTFNVVFKPSAAGDWMATVRIASNDIDENPFDVTVTGKGITVVLAPEIVIEQPAGSSLVDGKSKRDYGTVKIGRKGKTKTFIIRNIGTAKLTGIAITTKGGHARDFVISRPAMTSLNAGTSTTFKVTFKPRSKGAHVTDIHIRSNDANENPFDIRLKGFGVK